MVFKFNLRWLD